jgi:predicted XRE-type DNA-binding protein
MGTDAKIAVDQPGMTGVNPKPPRDKVMRIATMTSEENPAIRSVRQTLITAIKRRITQQRLTAAQAADILHLTGPRVTQLLQANVDEFRLDELVNLLPALELTIHVQPAPEQDLRSSG